MNLQRFLATGAGLTLENRVNRLIILLLIGVNCVLAVTINQTDRTVVYVATSTEEPVSLYISDGQSNDLALSLTLAPRYVPPREIRLTVPGYRSKGAGGAGPDGGKSASLPGAAREGNGNTSYVAALTDLLRAMAQRRVPWPAGEQAGRPARQGVAGRDPDGVLEVDAGRGIRRGAQGLRGRGSRVAATEIGDDGNRGRTTKAHPYDVASMKLTSQRAPCHLPRRGRSGPADTARRLADLGGAAAGGLAAAD